MAAPQVSSSSPSNTPSAVAPEKDPAALEKARFTKILEKTRRDARQTSKFDSAAVRTLMSEECLTRKGFLPHEWQLDVAEAVVLGLDTVMIAGTGCGKTLPFVLPLFADKTGYSKVIIVSTLNELEKEQVSTYMHTFISQGNAIVYILMSLYVSRQLRLMPWVYLRRQSTGKPITISCTR